MADHFSITVDVAELTAAMTKFGGLADELGSGGEGGKLGTLSGSSGGWTGQAATACLGEMKTISTAMTGAAPKFTAAHDAVSTFRTAVETAKNDTLPKLNTQWSESVTAYNDSVAKANLGYSSTSNDYRNMPPEDRDGPLKTAQATRDKAITSAATSRDSTQKTINGDYDAMITTLKAAAKTCGDVLGAAVVITFTAEQWAMIRGGGPIPLGLKFQLRAAAFGPDTILHHADGIVVGNYVATKLNDQAGSDDPLEAVDPEALALMKQFGTDTAFVEGLMSGLGPAGMAFLSYKARRDYSSPYDDEKKEGSQLLGILGTVYATGSGVYVTKPDGSTGPLMDSAWLDGFNPNKYSALKGDDKSLLFGDATWPNGYRPDLLLPFLTKPGISETFTSLVADRALTAYDNYRNHKPGELWSLYQTIDGYNGPSGSPFESDLFHIALERAGDYPTVSNSMLLTHRDSLMTLMAGQDYQFNQGVNHDWIGGPLGTILKQGTIGYQATDPNSADAALCGVAQWLSDHNSEKDPTKPPQFPSLLTAVRGALGDVVTDPRMMNGAVNSVGGPFANQTGFQDDPAHSRVDPKHPFEMYGPYMGKDLWAALHTEAMGDPHTATKIIQQFGGYIDQMNTYYADQGNTVDSNGKIHSQSGLGIIYGLQAQEARSFLGENLLGAQDTIKTELASELEANGKSADLAKTVLGKMASWVQDPKSIVTDLGKGAVDWTIDQAVDGWLHGADAKSHANYDPAIASLQDSLNSKVLKTDYWTLIQGQAGPLAASYDHDGHHGSVTTPTRDYTLDGNTFATVTSDGNPSTYAHKPPDGYSSIPPQFRPENDDFQVYGETDKKVSGVMNPTDMNPAQRRAYLLWLEDPATQGNLMDKVTPLKELADTIDRDNQPR